MHLIDEPFADPQLTPNPLLPPHELADSHFSRIDPGQIRRREAKFNELELSNLTPDELYRELMFVISLREHKDDPSSDFLPTNTRHIDPGTPFWRGRPLQPDDHQLPLRGMKKIADAWEPPTERVKSSGRLNKPGESLLYTAYAIPDSVPYEIRVEDEQWFILIKYVSARRLSLTEIGLPIPIEHLSKNAAIGATAISDFFARQFTRKATLKDGEEYMLSELIAKFNYDLPPEFHQGWIYPSVERPGALNATILPAEAHSRLELKGVIACKVSRADTNTRLSGYAYSPGPRTEDGDFIWFHQGSDFQKEIFPEFN